jgi:hypothetical protein
MRRPAVIPYEHRGARIRKMRLQGPHDVAQALGEFRTEVDPWLRKMIAERVLASDHVRSLAADSLEELRTASKCQIS